MSKISKLEEIANIIDSLHQTPNYSKEGISMIRVTDIKGRNIDFDETLKVSCEVYKEFIKKYIPKKGDIIMTRVGSYGSCSYISTDEKFCLGQNTVIISPKINGNYLYYSLISSYVKNQIGSFVTGSTQKTISLKDIKNIEIRIPSDSNVINSIAKVLSDLDAKIEINNLINRELEAMAKTLYDYWFVQFDFPDADGKPYKTSGGKMVWNVELKRDIPLGWEVKKIKEIAETGSGGTPLKSKKEYFENGTIPWINSGEVNASFIITSRKFITKNGLDNSSAKLFKKGTILMAMYGATAGQVSLIDLEASTNQAVCGIMPKDERMIPYLKYGLHQLYEYLINLSSGSARDNLSQDKIKELSFVIPEDNIIDQFYKISNSHFEMILKNLKENQELSSLRDWLLPMLMNGQVSVGEVEEELRMVAEPSEIYRKEEKKIVIKAKKVKVLPIKLNPVDVYKRTLLAAEIVFQLKDTYTLGHLKLQKMLYLCQEIENMSLPMNFLKQAMGPYDNQLARSLDKQFIEKKWFIYQKGEPLKYKPLENCGKHKEDFKKYFETEVEQINYLINKFKKFTSNQIEAVATLYACWKESIEKKELITDKLIMTKFYQWSKEKEKFREENLFKALDWMRRNGIEPK